MKKIYLLFFGCCLVLLVEAQISKTVELTSGNLTTLLTEEEKNTITSLTLVGTVDARDFITTALMPQLTDLDLSQTRVTAINTIFADRVAISYPDTIGSYGYNPRESASLFSSRLTTLKLPSTLKAIDVNGLSYCSGLTTIKIPPTVTFIGLYAFWGCTGLISLDIPPSVTYIETYAFFGCSGLKELTLPSSIERIHERTFAGCSSLTTLTIPKSVKSIWEAAFTNCTALTTVILPESLLGIKHIAFMNCPNITAIYSYNPNPPEMTIDAFNEVDTAICIVYVPYGSKALYAAAEGWKSFQNIVESLPGFSVSVTSLSFDVGEQSATVEVNSPTPWTAQSNQSWLTVTPLSGEEGQTITLTAEANTTYDSRTAIVTVSISETLSKEITIVQKGITNVVHLESPGTLATQLSEQEMGQITRLTITGMMDARDFKTIREKMQVLAILDISAVTIEAYTNEADHLLYPENTIPQSNPHWIGSWDDHSLRGKTSLTTIVLPASLTGIGIKAFEGCTGLQTIDIPSMVTRIDAEAFYGCTTLTECTLPSSLLNLGMHAFYGCSSLVSLALPPRLLIIDRYTFSECSSLVSVIIPESVTEIRENGFSYCSSLNYLELPYALKTIGSYAFYQCTNLLSVTIPSSVTSIYSGAFGGCSELITLHLPRTLKLLEPEAFGYCTSLYEIFSYAPIPLQLPEVREAEPGVFNGVDQSDVTLYVPEGSKALYEAANQWEDFGNIVEMESFPMSANTVILESSNGMATVDIQPYGTWTAYSGESWLRVNPTMGSGDETITITADDNSSFTREGKVTVAITDGLAQDITVIQKGKTINSNIHVESAGTLYTYLTEFDLIDITRLTLTGEIDARDFKLIRDRMPFLEALDLSGTTIEAYTGTEGTDENSDVYNEDEIPNNALDNYFDERKSRLTTLVLPESATVIGYEAFGYCKELENVEIPPTVTTIHTYAFDACNSITEMIIPPSVTSIRAQAFRNCVNLQHIELPSTLTEIGNAAFEDCISLTAVTLPASLTKISARLFYSSIALKTVEPGPAIKSIEEEAFFNCTSLESITIPASVTSIGYMAFALCESLSTVYAYPVNPPDLDELGLGVPQEILEKSILYVPIGTKELYAEAQGWEEFDNIIEMGEFRLEETTVTLDATANSEASVKLHSSLAWTTSSDQQWLSVSPESGDGGQLLTLTAQANLGMARTAIVTIEAQGMEPLTITVTQHALATGIDQVAQDHLPLDYYPNPFTQELSIEIVNPLLKETTVEIYSISGQRIKTLAKAQKGPKISLVWNGENEHGKQVPEGMYLLKMNGETRKVLKGL